MLMLRVNKAQAAKIVKSKNIVEGPNFCSWWPSFDYFLNFNFVNWVSEEPLKLNSEDQLVLLLRLCWVKLCSVDKHYTTASLCLMYLDKSTILLCMEYCCHVCAGAPSFYLELLDKLQKRLCRTVGPWLTVSLETLAHHRHIASLSLCY